MTEVISHKVLFKILVVALLLGIGLQVYLNYRVDICYQETGDLFKCSELQGIFRFTFFPIWFLAYAVVQFSYFLKRRRSRLGDNTANTFPYTPHRLSNLESFSLAATLSVIDYFAWNYLAIFLSRIGIFSVKDLELGLLLSGLIMIVFILALVMPAYFVIFKFANTWKKRILLCLTVFILSGLFLSQTYFFRSFRPYPLKFWKEEPINYEECVLVGKIEEDNSGKYCIFNRYPWSRSPTFYDNVSSDRIRKEHEDMPYFEVFDRTNLEMKPGDVKRIEIIAIDPLNRPISISRVSIYGRMVGDEANFGKLVDLKSDSAVYPNKDFMNHGFLELRPEFQDVGQWHVYVYISDQYGKIIPVENGNFYVTVTGNL